jgi:tRNA-Thr(GGU) m(6)t(6)A37 methyltransferase TsaA
MISISLQPIGYVRNSRKDLVDDDWDSVPTSIELSADFGPESLKGLEAFSHAEVIYHFDRVPESDIERGARHPRGNREWPSVGIFAQRGKNRPNRLGATLVEILGVEGRLLRVAGLDAVDGTPVLDIKPVMKEFLPRSPVRQPEWSHALMKDYWKVGSQK